MFLLQCQQTVQREVQHFKDLTSAAQLLLVSTFIYDLAQPLLFIFINAFIWRQTNDFYSIGIYSLGFFFTLPLSFILNGVLLRFIDIKKLFFAGLVGQSLVVALVFFFPQINWPILFLFGCLQGLPLALYWANRNFITVAVTQDEDRGYYVGLETVCLTLTNVVVPFLFGWIIILGERFNFYTAQQSYQVLIILITFVLALAGWSFQKAHVTQPKVIKLFVKKTNPEWNSIRWAQIFLGFMDRMGQFLPSLLVLTFLGNEGVLGTLESFAALTMAVIAYILGRIVKPEHRYTLLKTCVILLSIIVTIYTIWFVEVTIITFLIGFSILNNVIWLAYSPCAFKVIDHQEHEHALQSYSYIIDREIFLNIGRTLSMICFFSLIALVSAVGALRFIPIVIAVAQWGVLFAVRRIK